MSSVFRFVASGLAASAPVGMTAGRAQSLFALAVALTSTVLGWVALGRSARVIGGVTQPRRAVVALGVGLVGMILSGVRLATATGAIGTGSGRLGAIVALVVALLGTVLGGLALARSRQTSRSSSMK